MLRVPGATWQWVTAIAALVVCLCLGVHFGRYWERAPELPEYSTSPAEAAIQTLGMPLSDAWADEQRQKIHAALQKEVSLELVIQRSVEPSSWDTVGGPGSMARFPNAGSLIITQTPRVHDEIAFLLVQVHKSRQLQWRGPRE